MPSCGYMNRKYITAVTNSVLYVVTDVEDDSRSVDGLQVCLTFWMHAVIDMAMCPCKHC